jgi:hypothetical protein
MGTTILRMTPTLRGIRSKSEDFCAGPNLWEGEALQRLHRLPSDTLVYDLRFRFGCKKCNGTDFDVTVEELRTS